MIDPPRAGAPPLLDAGFVRELEAMRRRLEIRARSGATGEHLARRRGGAAEFHEHRAYAPGDDVRRIDWSAYARTGEPVLKLFRAEEDVIARVVCDASRSLDHGEPSKLDAARRMAAAVGYMALAGSERAQLFVAGEGVERASPPARGRGGLASFLRALDATAPLGRTDLARAIDAVVQRSPRPGLLAVLSDFLDRGPVAAALGRAAAAGHDLAIVHVVAPDEVAPDLEGDWALEDAETGEVALVTLDAAAIERYLKGFHALCDGLRAVARRHRATYVRLSTNEPLEGAVRRLVRRSID